MPIELPAFSRRHFLGRSLLAGAGMTLGGRLSAAHERIDPHSWALLSDTHIDFDSAVVARGVNVTENFKAVAAEVAALEDRPAGVLINGDCAYLKGLPGDYANFVKLLMPMRAAGLPVLMTLGNHDDRENFWRGMEELKERKHPLPDKHVAVVKTPRANWFFLDSLDKVNVTPGLCGESQLAWLAKALDANGDKPALVCAHHNLADDVSKGALIDTAALLHVLIPRRQVKAYIFGHTHDWKVTPHESGIHLVNLPPVAYVFKQGNPSGWVHATLEEKGMRLKLQCLDRNHGAHGEVREVKWRA
jgi:predicted phosphodiesterase